MDDYLEFFSPTSNKKYVELATRKNLKLAHYTSAYAASRIIREKRFWLRNARLMNDYDELLTGIRLFTEFWGTQSPLRKRFLDLIHSQGNEVAAEVQNNCLGPLNEILHESYIGCFSIHDNATQNPASQLGRLSMWRGYGANEAVALILNTDRFLASDSPYHAFTYPVLYGDNRTFTELILEFVEHLEARYVRLTVLPQNAFVDVFRIFLEQLILGFKHSGFYEEQEWRVVYRPLDSKSEHLKREYVNVGGNLQGIYTLPLENRFDEQEASFEIADLTHKIIIGPCHNQMYLQRLFSELLLDAGVEEKDLQVVLSNIPFR